MTLNLIINDSRRLMEELKELGDFRESKIREIRIGGLREFEDLKNSEIKENWEIWGNYLIWEI